MSALKDDIERAVNWHASIAIDLTRAALTLDGKSSRLMDKAETVLACAELPGDMPLRVRLMPYCYGLKA